MIRVLQKHDHGPVVLGEDDPCVRVYLLRSTSMRRRRRALWYCDSPLLKLLRQPYWSKSPLLGLGCIDSVAGIQPKGILSATTMYLAP